jgi:sugar phosphate isomerase/epimerase
MRLGVSGGPMTRDTREVNDRFAAGIAGLGFTGVVTHFMGDAATFPAAELHRVRDLLGGHGIRVVQSWGWAQCLVSPDETVRRDAVRTLQHAVRVAADLNALMVMTGTGSLNPRGGYWPHPGNHTPETEDRLVASLQETVPACETYGVPIALECHITTVLDSPQRVRRIIERASPRWIKANLDVVNFIPDIQTAFHNTALIEALFRDLGPYIPSSHLKDVYVEDRHVVHISETVPGDGILDWDTLLRGYEKLLPDGYAIIEHLPESLVPQAARFVRGKLAELGIPILA